MKYGLNEQQWKIVETLVLTPLKASGCKIWIYGSRARGNCERFSDLDLLIEGPIEPTKLSSIREALEESTLPIKVDLVPEIDLAHSYRETIEKDKKRL